MEAQIHQLLGRPQDCILECTPSVTNDYMVRGTKKKRKQVGEFLPQPEVAVLVSQGP